MTNSSADRTQVECSTCGSTVTAEIWLIIDDTERPDLVRLLRDDVLHRMTCPTCGADLIEADAPVVLYRPHRDPAVLFFPAKRTTPEEDDERAGALLSELRDRLGDMWQAEWLQPLNRVSQEMARFVLSDEAESFHPTEVGTLCTAALELTRAESWNDVRTLIQDQPALLTPLADVILAKLAADQLDARARVVVENNRVFLERCRAVGPYQALAKRSGVDRSARWPDEVIEAIRLFLAPPTWRGSRDVLEANPIVLLDPITDLAMADGAELLGDDPAMVEFVEGHRRVLDVARRSGIEAAFAGLSEPKAAPAPRTPSDLSAGGGSADSPDDDNLIELERVAIHRIVEADPDGPVARATAILNRSSHIADVAERIELLDEARHLVERDELPLMWQALTLSIAEALVYASRGDRSAGLETALALCAEAEQVADRERWPDLWGLLRSIQGEAYRHRTIGDRSDNLERAIACAEQALQIRRRDADPVKWAASQHNLGVAYLERVHGERADNVEKAIARLQQALQIRTRDHHPTAWADTQVSLGNANLDRICGSVTENVEQAITCFERALEVLTRQSEPQSWAQAMNSLGTAYRSRLLGNPADNAAHAIRCFQQALQVRTRSDAPGARAMSEVNLGNALLAAAGDAGGQQIEQAIACYQNALQEYARDRYPNDWAAVQINLGYAYGQRTEGDPRENRDRSAAALEAASGVYTRDAYPERWAAIQRNLASLDSADGAIASQVVLDHLQNALGIYTADTFPAHHRLLSAYVGGMHFDAGRWEEAHAAYESAIAAGEAVYQAATTTVARQAELTEAGDAVSHDAFCLARSGRFAAAVERIEGGRARALADALARDRVGLDSAAADDRRAFHAARQRIRALEAATRSAADDTQAAPTTDFAGYAAALQAARRDLANVVHRIRGYVTDFMDTGIGFGAIAAASAEPLIYLISTRRGGLALIVPPGANDLDERHCVFLDGFEAADLAELLAGAGGYLAGQVMGDPATLRTAMDRVLPVLAAHVMGPVAARLRAFGYQRATLIAGGGIALLPLHAAVADDVTLTYAPSARTLQSARVTAERRASLPLRLCGVADPLPNPRPLRFALLELTAIATLVAVASRQLLSGRGATRAAVVQGLHGATHLHFACHGLYRFEQPLASGLQLGNEEWLTLTMLLDEVGLPNARLAVLSACQTAITDIRQVPDEAIGLPAGFMQAGVPAVIGSLWPVEDLSTALLMDRFYRLHLGGDGGQPQGAASALRRAQCWLRDATGHELAAQCDEIIRAAGRSDADLYRAIRYFRSASRERPFAHPFYWAAFTFSGAES